MRITKEKLADLYMGYSVTLTTISGREYCIAASEIKGGRILAIDCETKEVSDIRGLIGGIMGIVPIEGEERSFIAIQKFYPVFKSEEAEVIKFSIGEKSEGGFDAVIEAALPLPFVHRVAVAGGGRRTKVFAATLCREKSDVDDWTSPGALYMLEFPEQKSGEVKKTILADGIHRNHGLFQSKRGAASYTYISGDEGVFKINEDTLRVKHILSEPVSDICIFDIDGDGEDEMAAIAPFHGDELIVYKNIENEWRRTVTESVGFGHGIWCGRIGAANYIILLERGKEKAIIMYEVEKRNGGISLKPRNIDVGVGATMIEAVQKDGQTIIYVMNHAAGEVARYTLTPNA
ncbi:MAG: hypothetical protein ACOYJD_00845 [Christensenellales bacterium]|jgi:hypothetical protein